MILFFGEIGRGIESPDIHLMVSKNGKAPLDIFGAVITWAVNRGDLDNTWTINRDEVDKVSKKGVVEVAGLKLEDDVLNVMIMFSPWARENPLPVIKIPWDVVLEFIEKAPKARDEQPAPPPGMRRGSFPGLLPITDSRKKAKREPKGSGNVTNFYK